MTLAAACSAEGCSFIAMHDGLCRWHMQEALHKALPLLVALIDRNPPRRNVEPLEEVKLLLPLLDAAADICRLVPLPPHKNCGGRFNNCPRCALEALCDASEVYYQAVYGEEESSLRQAQADDRGDAGADRAAPMGKGSASSDRDWSADGAPQESPGLSGGNDG